MFYGEFEYPPYWINYTYKSSFQKKMVDFAVYDGKKYSSADGSQIEVTLFDTLHIDPRGHFTGLRCAFIIVLDRIMTVSGYAKPLAEFCEFLANYPTF